jgi:hypothetical protein
VIGSLGFRTATEDDVKAVMEVMEVMEVMGRVERK